MVSERKQLGGQALRFALVGVIATLLHYGIYYFLQRVINVNIAYTIGYVLSFLVNFYLTAYFTFHSAPSWKKLTGMGGAQLFTSSGFAESVSLVGGSGRMGYVPCICHCGAG